MRWLLVGLVILYGVVKFWPIVLWNGLGLLVIAAVMFAFSDRKLP